MESSEEKEERTTRSSSKVDTVVKTGKISRGGDLMKKNIAASYMGTSTYFYNGVTLLRITNYFEFDT